MKSFNEFLNFDPLGAAEKISGESYKESQEVGALGMVLAEAHAEQKRVELGLRGDSYRAMSFEDYQAVVASLGFDLIYSAPVREEDTMCVYWRRGLLLVCDSFWGKINHATCYFNAYFPNFNDAWTLRLSGHAMKRYPEDESYAWSGTFHAIEGLVHTVKQLEDCSEILPIWIDDPRLHFPVSGKTDYSKEAVRAVCKNFPTPVREAVAVGLADWA